MFRNGEVTRVVRNTETGEVIEKTPICVEVEEGVPMGSEAGFPRRGGREDWSFTLMLLIVLVLIPVMIIIGIISAVSGH